ncbi:sialate O-acetylesterase [Flavobacterium algicola]|uniref:sialate O-acetylesterase n=1 Tax=Flavobacterium algicola TaxID=556529 RepID=UPI001EFED720|nr:sialate O-acetylesterase [Flavobacterium algicola]MCG9792163.1 sialate O-acetylesterase [Flavobacterium algicola]
MKVNLSITFRLFALLVIFFACEAHSQNSNTPDDVYLLIGQSNMAGRGPLEEITPALSSNILMLNKNNEWVIAKDPLHFDKAIAGVGPGISFAEEMLNGNKDLKIGLIPAAWGGSPLSVWVSGAEYSQHHPYDEAIARTKKAMESGKLKGILWHQGESDNNEKDSKEYLHKLKVLVANLRRDLGTPNLPFVAGEIGHFNKDHFINKAINSVENEIPNAAVVSSEGLTDKGDHLHFDTPSARILGVRYSEKMKILQHTISK